MNDPSGVWEKRVEQTLHGLHTMHQLTASSSEEEKIFCLPWRGKIFEIACLGSTVVLVESKIFSV